jgi:hypothetical protein
MLEVVLVNFRPDGSRRSLSLAKPVTVIGRRPDSDLRIPLANVSRQHCRLVKDEKNVRMEDLGSSNGTFVNFERVSLAVLQAGDVLSVGSVDFVLQIAGVPAEADLVAPSRSKENGHPARGGAASGTDGIAGRNRAGVTGGTGGNPASASEDEIDAILSSSDPGDSNFPDVMVDFDDGGKKQ